MMIKAREPVWHKKQKEQGIIPDALTGLDKQASWSKSNADGWVYGHGTFSIVSHKIPVLAAILSLEITENCASRFSVYFSHCLTPASITMEVRHHPQSRWLDECYRLKADQS